MKESLFEECQHIKFVFEKLLSDLKTLSLIDNVVE